MNKERIQKNFDLVHRKRLMYGSEEMETRFLSGVMMGFRDGLQTAGVTVEGVSDKWWFEHKQGPSYQEYIEKYGNRMSQIQLKILKVGYNKGLEDINKLIQEY